MSKYQYLKHSYTHKVIVATIKRKEDNKIMTKMQNQAKNAAIKNNFLNNERTLVLPILNSYGAIT